MSVHGVRSVRSCSSGAAARVAEGVAAVAVSAVQGPFLHDLVESCLGNCSVRLELSAPCGN